MEVSLVQIACAQSEEGYSLYGLTTTGVVYEYSYMAKSWKRLSMRMELDKPSQPAPEPPAPPAPKQLRKGG